jgi:hypothetical protein
LYEITNCTLEEGDYRLSCKAGLYSSGWGGGSITINGVQYCEEFGGGSRAFEFTIEAEVEDDSLKK